MTRSNLVALLIASLLFLALGPALAQNAFGPMPSGTAPPGPNPGGNAGTPPRPAGPTPAAADPSAGGERQDYGVRPPEGLHPGPMHGPTPATIPGGQVITTKGLVELRRNPQMRALVFDVLGGNEGLPGALAAVPAHQPGSFDDNTQQQFGQFLQQVTQGRKDTPLVFYCQSTQCWMSYNASVRAIRMGYSNVLWYRGGIEAWKQAGQPVQTAQNAQAAAPNAPGGQPMPPR